MNKNKALKNIVFSTIYRLSLLLSTLVIRRYMLKHLGSESVGIMTFFISLIGFLSIVELGVGTAITFSLYKPIVKDNKNEISALYFLYKRIYRIIAIIIFLIGLFLLPALPYMMKDNSNIFDIKSAYFIYLISNLITYLYADKTSFMNAYLDNYISSIVKTVGTLFEVFLQVILIIFISNKNTSLTFNLFFTIILLSNFIQWLLIEYVFKKNYSKHVNGNKDLDLSLKQEVNKKTKAMFFHKIGTLLVSTTDNIIISAFISVSLLGYYSNYITIASGIISMLALLFTSITSIIGHSYVMNNKEVFKKHFNIIYIINFIFGLMFFLGFYAVIDDLLLLIFTNDPKIILSKDLVLIITMNYYIQFMRNSVVLFKDSSGLFYNDRFKPLLEGLINLILSLILVKLIGISGVLIATIITNLFVTHTIEPYVLFKYGFNLKPFKYYLVNYLGIVLFFSLLLIFNFVPILSTNNLIVNIILNGITSITISFIVFLILYLASDTFRNTFKLLAKYLKKHLFSNEPLE